MGFKILLLWGVCLASPNLPAQQLDEIRDFSFDLRALGGQGIRAEDFRDNVLIVDFWGTWCPPCRQALPGLIELYKKYKHHGLEIVGLNYENVDDDDDAAAMVRDFAAQQGITYQLALGSGEVQRQVPGFSGYPTMLLFKRGLEHDKTVVGYLPAREGELETWVRNALGLDEDLPGAGPGPAEKTEGVEEAPIEETVPEGRIYRPGNGDRGFAFELEDADGQKLAFEALRGKPVVLAITTTWDEDAVATARFLARIDEQYGSRAAVIAACIERKADPAEKVAAIRAFREQHSLAYRVFPVDLSFTRTRIHRFVGVPLLLVFDSEGTLVLRATGSSPAIQASVETAVQEQLARR
jgi:thiol-disulfide isomerase/thioredoxin